MSRANAILNSTIMLMIEQRQSGGRWHNDACEFSFDPLYPMNAIVPLVVTDQAVYDATINTLRPNGYRHLTVKETRGFHETMPCWEEKCREVNEALGTTDQHVSRDCSVRCLSLQEIIRENAAYIGVREEHIRELAGRRHKRRRYFTDVNDLRSLRALLARTSDHG